MVLKEKVADNRNNTPLLHTADVTLYIKLLEEVQVRRYETCVAELGQGLMEASQGKLSRAVSGGTALIGGEQIMPTTPSNTLGSLTRKPGAWSRSTRA